MIFDYPAIRKFYFDKGAEKCANDPSGDGRFESAFYHTIKMVHDTTREQTSAESAGRIASLQSCYDTLLNNAADAHERIAELERTIKTLRAALSTTGEGTAALLAENAQLREILSGEPHH